MATTTAAANNFWKLIAQNTDWANIGDAAGLQNSATDGSLWVSLHTASPGAAGTQATNETAYTNYVRIGLVRTGTTDWTVATNVLSNTGVEPFATCGVTGSTVDHVGLGTASAGAGNLLFYHALSSSLAVSSGITPQFAAGALQFTMT